MQFEMEAKMTYFLLGALDGYPQLRSSLEDAARERGFRVATSLHQIEASIAGSGPLDELIAVSGDVRQLTNAIRTRTDCTIIYIGPLVGTVIDSGWEWINPESPAPPGQLLSYVIGRARLIKMGFTG